MNNNTTLLKVICSQSMIIGLVAASRDTRQKMIVTTHEAIINSVTYSDS